MSLFYLNLSDPKKINLIKMNKKSWKTSAKKTNNKNNFKMKYLIKLLSLVTI